jgi:hypothetical protein
MVYDPVHDRLIIYYNQQKVNGTGNTFVRFNYYDGNSIFQQYTVSNGVYYQHHENPNNAAGSPSFIRDSTTGKYYCFGVDESVEPHRLQRWDSADDVTYYNLTNISIVNSPSNSKGVMDLWHCNLEVLSDGTISAMCDMADYGSTGTNGTLYLGTMQNLGDSVTIQSNPLVTIGGGMGSWDSNRIYRSSSIRDLNSNLMKVWYSACGDINGNTYNYWGLGYMEFSKNATGVWVPNNLNVNLNHVRIATYQNAAYLSSSKNWLISQGADTSGNGVTSASIPIYIHSLIC